MADSKRDASRRAWLIELTDNRAESAQEAQRRLTKLLQLSLPTQGYSAKVVTPVTENPDQI